MKESDKNNRLEHYLEREFKSALTPSFTERVMERVREQERVSQETPLHFGFALSLVAAAVVAIGVVIGSSFAGYTPLRVNKEEAIALEINDSQIENLNLYNIEE